MTTALARYERPLEMAVASAEDFRALLSANAPLVGEVLPQWASVTHLHIIETANAYLARASNPGDILRCDARSILQSVCDAAELGLVFTPALGQAYLVPFKGKCTLMLGYRGLADLVRRAAGVTVLDSGVIYQGEVFEAVKGDKPMFKHIQRLDVDRSDNKVVGAYAIAHYPNGMVQFEVLGLGELKKVRAVSRMSGRGPWQDWFGEMCRKTAIRRLAKLLPVSAEKAKLVELTFAHEDRLAGVSPALTPTDRTRLALAPAQDSAPAEARVTGAATEDDPPNEKAQAPAVGAQGVQHATPPSVPVSPARQRLYDLLRAIASARQVTFEALWATVVTKAGNLDPDITIWTTTGVVVEAFLKLAETVIRKEKIDAAPFLDGGPEHQLLPSGPASGRNPGE